MPDTLDSQIERTHKLASAWFKKQPPFDRRVNLGAVVGLHGPSVVSEADCAVHFARFLSRAGVPWKDMHHEVSLSKWLITPSPNEPKLPRWRVDLGIIEHAAFRSSMLPLKAGKQLFAAAFEFKLLDDYWQAGGVNYGEPGRSRRAVEADAAKVRDRYLDAGVAKTGWVIVVVAWLATATPFRIFWASEDGDVRVS